MSRNRKGKYPTKVGNKHTRLYKVYLGMKYRCFNPSATGYHNYGGRGITVCEEWLDYDNFYEWAMTNGYNEVAPRGKCTLDRIDVNGNYEPSNCRWVDMKTQARNRRDNLIVEGMCAKDYAEKHKINPSTVSRRVHNNIDVRKPIEKYKVFVEGKTLTDISKETGISISTIKERYRMGMNTLEELMEPIESKANRRINAVAENNTEIYVERKSLHKISEEYNIKYCTLWRRYKKGARTLDELIKPLDNRGSYKRS